MYLSGQNLQDFVYNGNYDEIDTELKANIKENPYISMSTDYIARTKLTNPLVQSTEDRLLGQRNREDPMLHELTLLQEKILNTKRGTYLTNFCAVFTQARCRFVMQT